MYKRLLKLIERGEIGLYEQALKEVIRRGECPALAYLAMKRGLVAIAEKHAFIQERGLPAHLNVEPAVRSNYFCH